MSRKVCTLQREKVNVFVLALELKKVANKRNLKGRSARFSEKNKKGGFLEKRTLRAKREKKKKSF